MKIGPVSVMMNKERRDTMENREEWRQVLRQHAARYPAMQPRDGVKLAYQSAFGGGHMVTDLAACTDWIEKEKQTAPAAAEPFEDIGGGYARLQLGCPAVKELPSWVVARVFAASAQPGMDPQALAGRLEVLRQETAAGTFGFSAQELEAFLREYEAAGCPAVHHSDVYRAAYAPAYRVVDARYKALWPMLAPLAGAVAAHGRFTLAIDGMAAAGKSTAARLLQQVFGGSVVHMDDFFLPLPLRTEERLAEPGGNVHYERAAREVMEPLRTGTPFTYRRFDCSVMDFGGDSDPVDPAGNVIVEGSYALHPAFGALPGEAGSLRHPAELAVFLQLSPETQRERIRQRNGEEMLLRFEERWIPLENRYYAANRPRLEPLALWVE